MKDLNIWLVGKRDSFIERFIKKVNASDSFNLSCVFEDGHRMMDSLKNHKPDIIIIDFEFTGTEAGLKLLKQVLHEDKYLKLVIFLSLANEKIIFSSLCTGVYDYYIKSHPLTNVVEKLTQVINSDTPLGSILKNKIKRSFESVTTIEKEYNLTEREKEILNLIIGGLTKRKIAEMLALSFHTIDSHLRNIYRKLGVQSKSQAITKALKEQVVISE